MGKLLWTAALAVLTLGCDSGGSVPNPGTTADAKGDGNGPTGDGTTGGDETAAGQETTGDTTATLDETALQNETGPTDVPKKETTPIDPCLGKECGTAPDGTQCGTCAAGKDCNAQGKCVTPKNAAGDWCGPVADTPPSLIPDPQKPGQDMTNPAYAPAVHAQCKENFCLSVGQGIWPHLPACTKTCSIDKDNKVNATGADGKDGIEDADSPQQQDCDGFVDGPMGAVFRCVNFASADVGQAIAYCVPGTTFAECDANADCPKGESCHFTTMNGELTQRCFTIPEATEGYEVVGLAQSCNDDDPDAGLSYCDSGLCYSQNIGCVYYCQQDSDCDTTHADPALGCNTETGFCKASPDMACTKDLDCSAWYCQAPKKIFGDNQPYEPRICWAKGCETNADCADGYYCLWLWNQKYDEEAGWSHICVAEDPEGVGPGEACDANPDDNIPGDECMAAAYCFTGGYCSQLCNEEADCAADNGQLCAVFEVGLDKDSDGVDDQLLKLGYCHTLPDYTTDCLATANCTPEERCSVYEAENLIPDGADGWKIDETAPVTLKGKCVPRDKAKGNYGDPCMTSAECNGFCLYSDPAKNQAGFCLDTCETKADCQPLSFNDGAGGQDVYEGRCQRLFWSDGLELKDPTNDIHVALCLLTAPGSTLADCKHHNDCGAAAGDAKACLPIPISFGPDYQAKIEQSCIDITNQDKSIPSKKVGAVCDPKAEDANQNPIQECESGLCFEAPEAAKGYCTELCDQANDTCAANLGIPTAKCLPVVAVPRKGAYAYNSGVYYACRRDEECSPCFISSDCPGNRTCANLGQDDGTLAAYRCVDACTQGDAAPCGGKSCSSAMDGAGNTVWGCFDKGADFPINLCPK
jgi:hypothetical protein